MTPSPRLPFRLGLLGLVALPFFAPDAKAACDVAGAGIEEAIAAHPTLRESANKQTVQDLRTLRDAAIILETYGRSADCEKLVATVRNLAAHPAKTIEASGDTDEDKAERIEESRRPKAPEAAKKAESEKKSESEKAAPAKP